VPKTAYIEPILGLVSAPAAIFRGKSGDVSEMASLLLSRAVGDFNYISPSEANLTLPKHTV
jgi:hypothetical protein